MHNWPKTIGCQVCIMYNLWSCHPPFNFKILWSLLISLDLSIRLTLVVLTFNSWAWLYQTVQKLVLKYGSNEPNIQIKLILSQRYCMNEIRVIETFLGSGSLDPNIWVLLPFLYPNIRTLLWWKYIKDVVIMWLAWQTWLTQPGKFNLQL